MAGNDQQGSEISVDDLIKSLEDHIEDNYSEFKIDLPPEIHDLFEAHGHTIEEYIESLNIANNL